jgi:hypothetical protein
MQAMIDYCRAMCVPHHFRTRSECEGAHSKLYKNSLESMIHNWFFTKQQSQFQRPSSNTKMKYSIAAFVALGGLVQSLPTGLMPEEDGDELLKRMFLNPRAIDSSQPVPVDGAHAYHPANFAAGEIRGPCPGLNALVCSQERSYTLRDT